MLRCFILAHEESQRELRADLTASRWRGEPQSEGDKPKPPPAGARPLSPPALAWGGAIGAVPPAAGRPTAAAAAAAAVSKP